MTSTPTGRTPVVGEDTPRRVRQQAEASGNARITQVAGDQIQNFYLVQRAGDTHDITPHPPVISPGELVSSCTDPFAFEVHRAIRVEASPGGADLPMLPRYVEREHDRRLHEAVQKALEGCSSLLLLVGGSSTGKTRACWEAVQSLPGDWRLWHPIDPARPEAALAGLESIGPRTVVWINETQHYLITRGSDMGEQLAAKLRVLLRDPLRAPVLMLGTIWPEYWAVLTTPPAPGEPDTHTQARALLADHSLRVPSAFSDRDLPALRAATAEDDRLAQALMHAEGLRITQYLAGGPALRERYDHAPAGARALIDAAMDARRLGHGIRISLDFLEAAAPSYLTDGEWDEVGENWIDEALTYATASLRGTCGPLTRVRARPDEAAPDWPQFRLADYLEQHALASHRFRVPPKGFWEAAARHIQTVQDLDALAEAADARMRLRHSARLLCRAAGIGDVHALKKLAWMASHPPYGQPVKMTAGKAGLAEELAVQAAEAGDPDALCGLARFASAIRQDEEAERLYRRAVEHGSTEAMVHVAHVCLQAGNRQEAAKFYQQAVDAGLTTVLAPLAKLRLQAGDVNEAKQLLQRATDAESSVASVAIARWQEKSGVSRQTRDATPEDPGTAHMMYRVALWERGQDFLLRRSDYDSGQDLDLTRLVDEALMRGQWAAAEKFARLAWDAGELVSLYDCPYEECIRDTSCGKCFCDDFTLPPFPQYGLEADGSSSAPWTVETIIHEFREP
ncbi:hypothetical protein OG298_01445 [Streptomyces sp. NBC_01005]|uniref:tetratricopeptide repeat protein n=1 Tax=Streptomyces sp. NBC_01005 TaxID=2903715 RepID=UPI00386458C1|nr:hypothetical protein OG298_01445 [Streptomyces sp. NBC_01005]